MARPQRRQAPQRQHIRKDSTSAKTTGSTKMARPQRRRFRKDGTHPHVDLQSIGTIMGLLAATPWK
jgi:hypothetical protein